MLAARRGSVQGESGPPSRRRGIPAIGSRVSSDFGRRPHARRRADIAESHVLGKERDRPLLGPEAGRRRLPSTKPTCPPRAVRTTVRCGFSATSAGSAEAGARGSSSAETSSVGRAICASTGPDEHAASRLQVGRRKAAGRPEGGLSCRGGVSVSRRVLAATAPQRPALSPAQTSRCSCLEFSRESPRTAPWTCYRTPSRTPPWAREQGPWACAPLRPRPCRPPATTRIVVDRWSRRGRTDPLPLSRRWARNRFEFPNPRPAAGFGGLSSADG
jgi:hypothetical protein